MSESTNPCRAFFENCVGVLDKVALLQQQKDAIEWEGLTASANSPGPVHSEEQVLRLVFNPIHFDPETRTLKPTAVTDVKDKGCSVDRLAHTTLDKARETGASLAAIKNELNPDKLPRSLCGVAVLSVSAIREIKVGEQSRAFAVYDTALETNLAHADVCQLTSAKGESRSARLQLMALADQGLRTN
jgi:hypothetical protein